MDDVLGRFLEVGRADVRAASAAVTRHRRHSPMTVYANVGYETSTLERLDRSIIHLDAPTTRHHVRTVHQDLLFWHDPAFGDGPPALLAGFLHMMRGAGYREGTSVRLAGRDPTDMTVLHLSFPEPTIEVARRHRVRLLARMLRPAVDALSDPPDQPLSPRQRQVLRAAGHGLTNDQIASHLGISRRTVATHLENIYTKLGTSSRSRAVAWAATHGLLDTDTEVVASDCP